MRQMFIAILALGLLAWVGTAQAQETEGAAEAEAVEGETAESSKQPVWWEEEEETSEVRGYIGGLLAAGFGVNGQSDTGTKAYVDTSVLFALRGGLLLGKGNRWMLGFEVAPVTNRLDWRLSPTATGFVSFGSLVSIKDSKKWAWLWKVGVGVGGGLDWRFLVGVQLDVLTFNYKMSDRLWIDFGVPTMRFHIETASQARYNAQFVFPFGITFAI
jgi:hypothetical protein